MTGPSRLAPRAAALVLVAGLVAAGVAGVVQQRHHDTRVRGATAALADRVAARLEQKITAYGFGIRGLRSAIAATGPDAFDRAAFERWSATRRLIADFPGVRGYGYIRRVPAGELDAYARAMRREFGPSFQLRQLAPWDGDHRVVTYIAPLDRNAEAVGLDVGSDPVRRAALDLAARGDAVTMSAPLTLVQARAAGPGAVALVLPVHRTPRAEDVVAPATDALADVAGWTVAVLVMDEVLAGLEGLGDTFELTVTDAQAASGPSLYASPSLWPAAFGATGQTRRIALFGRLWDLRVRPTEAGLAALGTASPLSVSALSGGVALLLSACTFLAVRSRERASLAAAERRRRAAVVDHTADAVVGIAADGRIDDWNAGAEAMLGFTRAEVLGQPWPDVLRFSAKDGPDDASAPPPAWRPHPSAAPVEARVRRRGGGLVDVSVVAASLEPGAAPDAPGALALVMRDIGPLEAARRQEERARERLEQQVAERTAALHDSESLLASAGELARVGGWQVDLDTGTLTWSAETRRMHAVPDDYVPTVGAAIAFYEPQARGTIEAAVQAGIAGTTDGWDLELPLRDARGRPLWVRAFGRVERRDGRPVRLVGAIQDVTEQRRARTDVALARARFAVAARAASLGVWERHLVDGVEIWDEGMHALYGTDPAAGAPSFEAWAQRVHPDDLPGALQALQGALDADRPIEVELRVRRTDGEERLVRTTATVQRDADGRPVSVIGVDMDVTERRRAALALQSTTQLLQGVLDAATDVAIVATGPDHRITVFNAGAERLFGFGADDMIGRRTPAAYLDMAAVAAGAQELSARVGRVVVGLDLFVQPEMLGLPGEWPCTTGDGRPLQVRQTVTPIPAADGGVAGFLAVSIDTTAERAAASAMAEARRSAEDASAAKSRFLGNISHEIRTPMNGVIGLTELLAGTPLDADQADLVRRLAAVADGLMDILNDVLDLSKIEAGELPIDAVDFSLRGLLAELDAAHGRAGGPGPQLVVTVPPDLPDDWHGDALRVRQILGNLLGNAIKFSPGGRVVLAVDVPGPADGADGATVLRFSVADDGIGMSQRQMERLFTPFAQGDASIARRFGGTGLGLAIVRELVQLLGGHIGVASREGAGTRFDVTLPLRRAVGPVAPRRPRMADGGATPLRGLRLLVVDDSEINRVVAVRQVQRMGAQAVAVDGGEAALQRLADDPTAFDAVLMDVQMPGLDGCETTRRLRARPATAWLPVIALTAGVLVTERNAAIDSGMNGFVGKPFTSAAVVDALRDAGVVGERAGSGRTVAASSRGLSPAPAAAVAGWPSLPGIDRIRSIERTGGDRSLFTTLLGLLLDDATSSSAAERATASHWHRMRGGAAALGAVDLEAATGRAETAARDGDAHALAAAVADADRCIAALREAGEALLAARARAVADAAAAADAAPVDAEALAALESALRRHDLAARQAVERLLPGIRRLAGEAEAVALADEVTRLAFGAAADRVARLRGLRASADAAAPPV